MAPKTRNQVLLIVAYLFLGAAILTLFPGSARIKNDLGYFSLCTFAPWSTLLLLLAAGAFAAIRTYMISRTD
jgi:hypothetical protein